VERNSESIKNGDIYKQCWLIIKPMWEKLNPFNSVI